MPNLSYEDARTLVGVTRDGHGVAYQKQNPPGTGQNYGPGCGWKFNYGRTGNIDCQTG